LLTIFLGLPGSHWTTTWVCTWTAV
jgi:hypothetical protein